METLMHPKIENAFSILACIMYGCVFHYGIEPAQKSEISKMDYWLIKSHR